jgi:TonB family protein
MKLLRRNQCMGLIFSLSILFISFIEPNECLFSHSNEVKITGSKTIIVKDEIITSGGDFIINSVKGIAVPMTEFHYIQYRDSLRRRINDTVSYPGGESVLQKFLFKNNVFNSSKSELSFEGIVALRLSIDTNGFVYNTTILRSVGGDIDEEALRLANLLVFNPATDSYGKAISSEYILKVYFNRRKQERASIDVAITMEIDDFEKLYYRNGPASYPGGKQNMKQYFRENLVYPTTINERNIEGKVRLLIFINKNGYISVVHVINSPDQRFNEEAIRLVKSVGRWKPLIRNDEPANGILTVDVKFKQPKRNNIR